jgi:hypothetical protein
MKNPTLIVLIFSAFYLSGCRSISTVKPKSQNTPSVATLDASSLIRVESLGSDTLAIDTVSSDGLLQDGFVILKERFTNISDQDLNLSIEIPSSNFQLQTRIQEHAQVAGQWFKMHEYDYVKDSHLDLNVSEVRIEGDANGVSDLALDNDGNANYELAHGMAVEISWVAKAALNVEVCPFWANLNFWTLTPSAAPKLQWSMIGSELDGSFVRSVGIELSSGDEVPVISNQSISLYQTAGSGVPNGDDRLLGCDGLIQILASP